MQEIALAVLGTAVTVLGGARVVEVVVRWRNGHRGHNPDEGRLVDEIVGLRREIVGLRSDLKVYHEQLTAGLRDIRSRVEDVWQRVDR